MDDSNHSTSSVSSIRRRRNKIKTSKITAENKVLSGDSLVETNPEWINLMSQIQTRSKAKKAKEIDGNPGSVLHGGISKK